MRRNHVIRRFGLTVPTLAPVLALIGMTGSATAYPVQYCAGAPIINGTPPWGFHTGSGTSPTG